MTVSNLTWWEKFFSANNQLNYKELENGTAPDNWSEDVMFWHDITLNQNIELPIVLPHIDQYGQVSWYAGANSEKVSQRLSDELQAFIGSSYSDFIKKPITINLNDQSEFAFSQICSHHIFKFKPIDSNQIEKIRRAIRLYVNLIKRYQAPKVSYSDSFGKIRSDFDKALLVGNEKKAHLLVEQLKQIGRLSAENKIYLDIRLLAGLNEWEKIAYDSKRIKSLVDLVLPPQVLADIVESLYRVYIEEFEINNDAQGALNSLCKHLAKPFPMLFSSRRGVSTPRVLKAFYLFELSREKPDNKLLYTLLKKLSNETTEFVSSLSKLIAPKDELVKDNAELEKQAEEAFDDYEFERALNFYIQLPPSKKRLSRLLSCAKEIHDYEIAKKVIKLIEHEHDKELDALAPALKKALDAVYEISSLFNSEDAKEELNEDPRRGWIEWARCVNRGIIHTESNMILQNHALNWSVESFKYDNQLIEELSDIIGNSTDDVEIIFREAYPKLLDAFVLKQSEPVRNFKPLLFQLFTLMVMMEGISADELELVRELVNTLLTIGLSSDEYSELVENLSEILESNFSVLTLAWTLDITEILVINPCSSDNDRLLFFIKVLDLIRKITHRLELFHIVSLKLLCKDFNIDVPQEIIQIEKDLKNTDDPEDNVNLSGKTLAIYTLTEGAAKRAKEILENMYQGLNIILNHDKTLTNALDNLAKTADYFIFTSKSAAHQAFYPVSKRRDDLIYPLGKGSTSIIHSFKERINVVVQM